MSWDPTASAPVVFRPVDNSRIVREVDPRSSRDLWALVLALGLYAWPHYQMRQTTDAAARMLRERETLLEQNRKLKLEKAALEDLRRVEVIARRDLKMVPPAMERVIVVEVTQQTDGLRLAAADRGRAAVEN